jgi:hypothetical protein
VNRKLASAFRDLADAAERIAAELAPAEPPAIDLAVDEDDAAERLIREIELRGVLARLNPNRRPPRA